MRGRKPRCSPAVIATIKERKREQRLGSALATNSFEGTAGPRKISLDAVCARLASTMQSSQFTFPTMIEEKDEFEWLTASGRSVRAAFQTLPAYAPRRSHPYRSPARAL
jgi:hypothetical protein